MKKIFFLLLLVAVFLAGYMLRSRPAVEQIPEDHTAHEAKAEKKAALWTCSMHPQIKMDKPGKCPICGMTLVPVSVESSEKEAMGASSGKDVMGTLTMSENAKKIARVATSRVERKYVDAKVRMVGKIDFDETLVKHITSWVPGRLDKLYVSFTGVSVKKGDHMVYQYSPELLTAQTELLQAANSVQEAKRGSKFIQEMSLATLVSSRERLRLWGLTTTQIKKIERLKKPTDHITILAPMSGIVIQKNAFEGMYVKTGTRIYTIADLSHLWVTMDAYESDLIWLRYGQKVEFTTEAYPGETFQGTVAFIDPVLNPKTRTAKVRINVENKDGKLKPEMFVRAIAHSKVAQGGRVMNSELAGKWICPMHPEFVSDKPGNCDICDMKLVKAESLGYIAHGTQSTEAPLVVPVTAVLRTGTRAVVYVEVPNKQRPTYQGRQVVLGPRAGDYYLVKSGLAEGERVVVNGNFKIDSALQIQAEPSMMNPEGGGPAPGMHMNMGGKKMKKHKGRKMGKMTGGMDMDMSMDMDMGAKVPHMKMPTGHKH